MRRSHSIGANNSMLNNSFAQKKMLTCRRLNREELLSKLHETLCEKDRLNERMTQYIREKLDSENNLL